MSNSLSKRALVGDLIVDMGAGAKRARTGGLYRGSTKFSESFIAGYRAYVFGGREIVYSKNSRFLKATGGIEPFDHLTNEQKAEWYAGIEYAQKERKECCALMDGKRREKLKSATFYATAKKKLKEMMKSKSFNRQSAAKKLGVSSTWICEQIRIIEKDKE